MNTQIPENITKDIRYRTTIWIWSLSIPLLCACVPIIAISDIGIILPLCVLSTVVLATASVWYFAGKPIKSSEEIEQLKERIQNLEYIATHDQLDSNFKILETKKAKKIELNT